MNRYDLLSGQNLRHPINRIPASGRRGHTELLLENLIRIQWIVLQSSPKAERERPFDLHQFHFPVLLARSVDRKPW